MKISLNHKEESLNDFEKAKKREIFHATLETSDFYTSCNCTKGKKICLSKLFSDINNPVA